MRDDLAERLEALIAREENPKRFPRALILSDFALLREAAAALRALRDAEVCTVPPESFTTCVLNNYAPTPRRFALVPLDTTAGVE